MAREALLEVPATAARIRVAHAALVSADPAIHEYSMHLDAQHKQIVASLAAKVDRATTQGERYARIQSLALGPNDLPTVHAAMSPWASY